MKEMLADPQGGPVLRDIHMPPGPGWWPPAPGWWVLFAAIGLVAIAVALFYRKVKIERLLRQRILAEIELLALRHADDDAAYAASLHQLLRRGARRYASDAHLLQGAAWRQVLARVPVDETTIDVLMTLDACMYQRHAEFDRPRMQAAVKEWLESSLRQWKSTEATHA